MGIPYLPDLPSREDGLGLEHFRNALLDVIYQGATPLTVGIFGTWGTGKTTFLRMLQEEVKARARREERSQQVRTVWFTAWKYHRHEALWRAFLLRVIDGLYPRDLETGERVELENIEDKKTKKRLAYLERLEEAIYETVTWQEKDGWTLDWGVVAREAVKIPIWLLFHLARLGDIPKELGLNPDLARVLSREIREARMHQLVSMEQFAHHFEQAIRTILGEGGRLIVFVDDLDRCLPEQALEVLEAIKLFLDVEGVVFVLGMDLEVVRRGIETHYAALVGETDEDALPLTGSAYLEKIIQIPFHLPSLDVGKRREFLAFLLNRLEGVELDDLTREVLARGLRPNPRQAKRVLNMFHLLRRVAEEQAEEQGVVFSPVLLAKSVLIQAQWPEVYRLWRQYPTLVQSLEEEFTRRPFTEEEALKGRRALGEGEDETLPEGGILDRFRRQRARYALLAEMLRFPEAADAETKRVRFETRFAHLSRPELWFYINLVGTMESEVEGVSSPVLLPEDWEPHIESGDPVRLKEVLAAWKEIEDPKRREELKQRLQERMVALLHQIEPAPQQRAAWADALDALGYQPDDLYDFVPIPMPDGTTVYMAKYPVTNAQYRRFLEAEDFGDPELWKGFPKFSEPRGGRLESIERIGDWGDAGWRWLQEARKGKEGVVFPRFWDDADLGIARPSAPVVGVTWWEAMAYARWVHRHWEDLEEGRRNPHLRPREIRLPTEYEWVVAAGGLKPEGRYPWDPQGQVTQNKEEIVRRANVGEGGIGRTTPVWAFPLGASPSGVMDMAGNVWEWMVNFEDEDRDFPALKGGSWFPSADLARVAVRGEFLPFSRWNTYGIRLLLLLSKNQ